MDHPGEMGLVRGISTNDASRIHPIVGQFSPVTAVEKSHQSFPRVKRTAQSTLGTDMQATCTISESTSASRLSTSSSPTSPLVAMGSRACPPERGLAETRCGGLLITWMD